MKLRDWRNQKGVKQKAVASAVGISRQTYIQHEKKPWLMGVDEAMAVCDFLGIELSDVEDFFRPRDVK